MTIVERLRLVFDLMIAAADEIEMRDAMSQIHSRPVTPMSLLIDVFVELERLNKHLEALRDEMVKHPEQGHHIELYDARRTSRRIDQELRCIDSLLALRRMSTVPCAPTPAPEPPPKGPPDLKLIS